MKYIFIAICFLFVVDSAIGQTKDTVITYYKFSLSPFGRRVKTADSADYVRIIYPDHASKLHDIREYYIDGTVKLMGTIDLNANEYIYTYVGDFISYYQNGKKQSISHFTNGQKVGLEYLFRPDGQLYSVKNCGTKNAMYNDDLCWEFYDLNGNMICKNGNGKWIIYDEDFKTILISGDVKNGFKEGEWKGFDIVGDTINYVFNYKKNIIISGRGYDKTGKVYPFKNVNEEPTYKRGNLFDFLTDLNRHLILPKDINGRKMNIDTAHISFIVEKDGSVSNMEPLGNVNPQLKDALNNAIAKCGDWIPNRYYGIPYRTWFMISLKAKETVTLSSVSKRIDYKGNIIQDSQHDKISVQ